MLWQMQQVHPTRPDALAFETALASIVDAAAESAEAVDNAYFVLEDMHKQVTPRITSLWRARQLTAACPAS
jgi:hypothetical protein